MKDLTDLPVIPSGDEIKNNSKRRRLAHKPIQISRGNITVTIRYETPRGNRLPYRIEWTENGQDCSEMCETLEKAKTQADVKLTALSSGQRTLTKAEVDDLFGFKQMVESFNLRLAAAGRTLEQVVSDTIAAAEILPGWTAAAMAQFISSKHGVDNPKTVDEVHALYIQHLEGGYKRDYVKSSIQNADLRLGQFAAALTGRRIDLVDPVDVIRFIKDLRVKPNRKSDPSKIGKDGLMPASQKTKNSAFSFLSQMFLHARDTLKALPANLKTVVEMLEAPQFTTPTPEIYTPAELTRLFALLPDVECVLFVSLQLFAGLRPSEAQAVRGKHLKRDERGQLSYISIRQEVGKKDPTSGIRKARFRKAPITAPLVALLRAIPLPDGPLFRSEDLARRVQKIAEAAKFVWKYDALRHSFVAYRLEETKDRAQVAFEAGHGIDVQIMHYEGLVEQPEDVQTYWGWSLNVEGLPFTLNHQIVGTKVVRQHAKAKQLALAAPTLEQAA